MRDALPALLHLKPRPSWSEEVKRAPFRWRIALGATRSLQQTTGQPWATTTYILGIVLMSFFVVSCASGPP
jgi:hypothetical protein